MYYDKKKVGLLTKTTPDKPFQTKDPRQKPPDKSPREKLREILYRGLLSRFFVLGLRKRGSEMCDVLWGVPGCVTKCDRGRESKLAKNSATYTLWTAPKQLV